MLSEQNNETYQEHLFFPSRDSTFILPFFGRVLFSNHFLIFLVLFLQVYLFIYLQNGDVSYKVLSVHQGYANVCKGIIMFLKCCTFKWHTVSICNI